MFFRTSFHLHILAGQSNAHGTYGNGLHYPPDGRGIDPEIPFFYTAPEYGSSQGQWVQLGPQSGMFQVTHFGPEVSFARSLWQSGQRPAIFKFTKPAVSLTKDWKAPGESGLYDEMCRELKTAMKNFRKKIGKCKASSLTWIQGESDAETDELARAYEARQLALLLHMRRLLRSPKLPVILGVNESHPWVSARPTIVTAQKRIVGSNEHMAYCSFDGLEKEEDSHLTPPGLVSHGYRLFDQYQAALNAAPRKPSSVLRTFTLRRAA